MATARINTPHIKDTIKSLFDPKKSPGTTDGQVVQSRIIPMRNRILDEGCLENDSHIREMVLQHKEFEQIYKNFSIVRPAATEMLAQESYDAYISIGALLHRFRKYYITSLSLDKRDKGSNELISPMTSLYNTMIQRLIAQKINGEKIREFMQVIEAQIPARK